MMSNTIWMDAILKFRVEAISRAMKVNQVILDKIGAYAVWWAYYFENFD